MKKAEIVVRMRELFKELPQPGEASNNQHINVTMFQMSLLTFLESERLSKLTRVLIALTVVLAVLTVALLITSFVR